MGRGQKIGIIVAAVVFASVAIAARERNATPVTNDGASASAANLGGTSGMRTVEVIDPLFNQVAYRVTIPANWLFDATVLRPHFGPALVFRASSPDGLTGIQLLPRYDWVMTDDPGMRSFYANVKIPVMPLMPLDDFIKQYVLKEARPGVTVIGPQPFPMAAKMAAADEQTNAQLAAQARRGTRPRHHTSGGARLRISYPINGHQVDEALVAQLSSE